MNMAIDIGNTAVKWATFRGADMVASGIRLPDGSGQWPTDGIEQAAICASGNADETRLALEESGIAYSLLTSATPLPIRLDYRTPDTLGPDRIAAACGAWALHPGEASLVIDAGTCITVDYIDAQGVYHGGAIMPGLGMSLQALHDYTARLPLVDADSATSPRIPGRSTEESIVAGTLGAVMLALAGYVTIYRQRDAQLHVLLTGGDAARLNRAGARGWETAPQLTLHGLNEIMRRNTTE